MRLPGISRMDPRDARLLIGGTLLVLLALVTAAILWAIRDAPPAGGAPAELPSGITKPAGPPPVIPFVRAATDEPRVMIVGTSLFAGYFTRDPEDRYSSLVFTQLESRGPIEPVTAERVPGGLTLTSSYPTMPDDLDLAVIELGTNDVNNTPLPEFSSRYEDLISQIRTGSPTAALVCLGAWHTNTQEFDTVIRTTCVDAGGTYVPLADLFAQPYLHGPVGEPTPRGPRDSFHPNEAGHRIIADRIIEAVEPVGVPAAAPTTAAP